MKNTLVALALAATTVSGSAMAWTAGGTGGSLELGGTLTPESLPNPWETMVGSAVTNLDAPHQNGATSVDIAVKTAIPVLMIRTQTNQPFGSSAGITPHIDFASHISYDQPRNGEAVLTLPVKNGSDVMIGKLTTLLTTAGVLSLKDANGANSLDGEYSLYALGVGGLYTSGIPFSGGLSLDPQGVISSSASAKSFLSQLNADIVANYNQQGGEDKGVNSLPLVSSNGSMAPFTFSGMYGAGILSGKNIKLTLDAPATSDTI
ncbi:hypothetical protein ACX9P6_004824, partial [Citrobacter braakii]